MRWVRFWRLDPDQLEHNQGWLLSFMYLIWGGVARLGQILISVFLSYVKAASF